MTQDPLALRFTASLALLATCMALGVAARTLAACARAQLISVHALEGCEQAASAQVSIIPLLLVSSASDSSAAAATSLQATDAAEQVLIELTGSKQTMQALHKRCL